MQRHPFRRRLGQLPLLVSVLFFCILGVRLLPQLRPGLTSSLKNLAVASALGSSPQHSIRVLRQEILSETDNQPQKIPIVEEIAPVIQSKEEIPIAEPPIETTTEQIEISPPPAIPEKYQGPIIEENLAGQAKTGIPSYGAGLIKNNSDLSDENVIAIASEDHELNLTADGPQVLIYHTHATESFEPYDSSVYDTRNTWRSTEETENMIAVGNELCAAMEAHGIQVIHDTTLHDYPSYNGSYERSAATISDYLKQYPTICVALDIHRDAIQRDTTLVKPVAVIDGEKTAQLMIIAGCDNSGALNIPTWKDNLRFGARVQNQIESLYPGLCRPLFFTNRKYNQHLTNASLLLEVGSHGNTLEEAKRCGHMVGDAIGTYLAALLSSGGEVVPPDSTLDEGRG